MPWLNPLQSVYKCYVEVSSGLYCLNFIFGGGGGGVDFSGMTYHGKNTEGKTA